MLKSINVFGEKLKICCENPKTGFFRDGCCNTSKQDYGMHTVCILATEDFLTFSKSVGNDLIFSCEGNFASSKIYRSESGGNMEFTKKSDPSVIVQGEFSLKSLSHFIKCTPLCTHLEMYLGNDLPLIVKYDVASLGSIMLCLAALPPS